MSKNNKMSKEDRIFVELIRSLFSEDEIKEFAKKLKKDCQKMDTKGAKETLNKVMDDVNKAKEVKEMKPIKEEITIDDFEKIELDTSIEKPKVGIVGEILIPGSIMVSPFSFTPFNLVISSTLLLLNCFK